MRFLYPMTYDFNITHMKNQIRVNHFFPPSIYSFWLKMIKNKFVYNLRSFLDEEKPTPGNMENFIKTDHYKELNIGFALDEGIASPTDVCQMFYAERQIWCK